MKVLILSEEKSIFNKESLAFKETLRSAEAVELMHVIVFTRKKEGFPITKISESFYIYPTNSPSRLLYIYDALKIIWSQVFWQSNILADLVIAQNSFISSLTSFLLSWKYKVHYIVDVYDNKFFSRGIKGKILRHAFAHATAIRVTSQGLGEIISRNDPAMEKKIFVLPFLTAGRKTTSALQIDPLGQIDIHTKYPQFNDILLTAAKHVTARDIKQVKELMRELRARYPRIGLVVVATVKSSLWHAYLVHSLPEYIVIEDPRKNNFTNYLRANIYVNFLSKNETADELTFANEMGVPIVSSDTELARSVVRDGENGFIADPRNVQLFGRKIMEILEIPGVRERMHLYKYNITELYGNDIEDYDRRLYIIWEACSTKEQELVTEEPRPALPKFEIESTKQEQFFPAFTLDTIKKTFKRFELNERKRRHLRPDANIMEEQVFDVDSVKLGIKEALQEVMDSGEFDDVEEQGDHKEIINLKTLT